MQSHPPPPPPGGWQPHGSVPPTQSGPPAPQYPYQGHHGPPHQGHYGPPHQGHYGPPQYAPYPTTSSGSSTVKIVLLVLGLIVFFFAACFGIGIKRGYDNAKRLDQGRHDTFKNGPGESATYDTKNHLVTAKYPGEYAAKLLDSDVLLVQRNDEIVTLFGTDSPASDDVNEFARASYTSSIAKLTDYREESRRTTTCGGESGREYRGQWTPEGETPRVRVICYFIHNEHGFAVSYSAPVAIFGQREAILRAIVDGSTYR